MEALVKAAHLNTDFVTASSSFCSSCVKMVSGVAVQCFHALCICLSWTFLEQVLLVMGNMFFFFYCLRASFFYVVVMYWFLFGSWFLLSRKKSFSLDGSSTTDVDQRLLFFSWCCGSNWFFFSICFLSSLPLSLWPVFSVLLSGVPPLLSLTLSSSSALRFYSCPLPDRRC